MHGEQMWCSRQDVVPETPGIPACKFGPGCGPPDFATRSTLFRQLKLVACQKRCPILLYLGLFASKAVALFPPAISAHGSKYMGCLLKIEFLFFSVPIFAQRSELEISFD
jgi:hypothetical protein